MNLISRHHQQKIKDAIKQFDLERFEDCIWRFARECVCLYLAEPDDYSQLGNSRVGGSPDLPADFTWPRRDREDLPCDFIAQLNLAQIPRCSEDLPASGMLWLFVGDTDTCPGVEHRIFYRDVVGQQLVRTSRPEDVGRAGDQDDYFPFRPYRLHSEVSLDLPDWFSTQMRTALGRDGWELWINDGTANCYSEMQDALRPQNRENLVLQLLGYPRDYNQEPAKTAYYAKIGRMEVENQTLEQIEANIKKWASDKQMVEYFLKMKEDWIWYQDNRDTVEQGALEWQMLLSVDSNMEVGFCWWDAGFIELMIREHDLRSLHFDDTHMTLFSL